MTEVTTKQAGQRLSFDDVMQRCQADMLAVDQVIHQRLTSDVALINQLSHYIVNSGGKRLRPMIAVLSAKMFNYQGDPTITNCTFSKNRAFEYCGGMGNGGSGSLVINCIFWGNSDSDETGELTQIGFGFMSTPFFWWVEPDCGWPEASFNCIEGGLHMPFFEEDQSGNNIDVNPWASI